MRHTLTTAAMTAAMIAALSSCDHKELCYTHPHSADIEVAFDWSNNSTTVPATMDLYVYPQDGGEMMRFQVDGKDGGKINLPLGDYDILCVSSASQYMLLQGEEKHHTIESYTRNADPLEHLGRSSNTAPRAEGTENEPVRITPDVLWHHTRRDVALERPDENHTVTFVPEDALCNYTYEIRNVKNLKYVKATSATLSGLGGHYLLGSKALTKEPVTVPLAASSDGDSKITGQFRTFGHCPASVGHKLMLYAVLADGSGYYTSVDVTDQVHSAPDQRNVHIVVDGLELPQPLVEEGGFHPTVESWEEVFIDLDM